MFDYIILILILFIVAILIVGDGMRYLNNLIAVIREFVEVAKGQTIRVKPANYESKMFGVNKGYNILKVGDSIKVTDGNRARVAKIENIVPYTASVPTIEGVDIPELTLVLSS